MLKKTLFLVLLMLPFFADAQAPTPLAFGQTVMQVHPTPASTFNYQTPFVQPGDVLLIRVSGTAMAPKFQIFSPSGFSVGTYIGDYFRVAQAIYAIPVGAESGNYTILVSDANLFYTGSFCISIERMNSSPASVFLPCNESKTEYVVCGAAIKSFRYLVQKDAVSRITVSTNLANAIGAEVWVCDTAGNILQHKATTYGQGLILDSITAQITGCYDVFVTDALGYYEGGFSISHNLLTGNCAAGTLTSNNPNNSICEGSPLSIGISGALPNSTFQWAGPNGFTSDQSQIAFAQVTTVMSGIYAVTVTSPNVCSSVFSKTITVNPLPTAIGSVTPASDSICVGEGFTLNVMTNAMSPVAYKWSGPAMYSSTQKSPSIYGQDTTRSGLYIISVTDSKGCINTDTVPVIVHAPPTIVISQPASGGVCKGSTLQLFAQTNASVASFSWTGPNAFSSTSQNPQIPNAGSANAGTYFVTVTDSYGCFDYELEYIAVWNSPIASISPLSASVCAGDSVKLIANGGNLYEWSTDETTKEIYAKPLQTKTYSVTVTDNHGCTDAENATVAVNPLPSISVMSTPDNPEICSGSGQILLCATSSNADDPVWRWTKNGSFFSNNQCISLSNPGQSGIFAASVTDGIGCSNTAPPDTVNIYQTPMVSISQITPPPYAVGDDITLCANSNASTPSYEWEGPNNFTGTTLCVTVGNASILAAGTYYVTVTDEHGCVGYDEVVIDITVGTVEPTEAWGLTVAPNPSGGIVQIWAGKPLHEKLEIVLFDANGRRIRDFQMETSALTLDLTDLPTGFYALRISEGQKVGAVRLAVVR